MAKKASPKGGKTKRKVSGKRGTAGRSKQTGVDPRGVIGIVILCVGLLALASQFIASGGGLLNQCTLIARGLGGTLCLLLPVVLCWAGVMLVFFSRGRVRARTMVCVALIFLFVETLLQLFQIETVSAAIFADGTQASYGSFLMRSYRNASLDCKGGGLIGALLAWPLYRALDVWGAVIVLIFASTIVLMVFTGVSFGNVGMVLSEWIDDLRAARAERREEREALRAVREEEELDRESVRAEQRQQKRMERERTQAERQAQQEAKAAVDAARAARSVPDEEEQPEPVQEEAPAPRTRKRKPKLEVVRSEPTEETSDEMPTAPRPEQPRRPVRTAAGPRKRTIPEDRQLYIERDDEFTRESINDRRDPQEMRRRARFTIQEAEDAFLHGMNAAQPQEESAPAQPTYSGYAQQSAYDVYAQETAISQQHESAYAADPVEAREMTYNGVVPASEDAGAAADDVYPPEPVQDEDDDGVPWRDMPDEPVQGYGVSQGEYTAQPRRDDVRAVQNGENRPVVDQSAPAFRVAPQSAAREEPAEDKTIVQLRGNRLDGTPVVLPRKDTHAGPEAPKEEYTYPPIDLLNRSGSTQDPNQRAKDEAGAHKLLATLESFGVQAKLTHVTHGPAITRYELQPAPGVKVSRIVGLVDDIALNMASDGVRIEAPIPGKPAVGIEIPNEKIETVSLRDVLESQEMTREKSPTAVALGKGISGSPVVADMAKMPHVLIAGATGSGKSVCINTIINSIIYRASPREVRLILIDPKVVELSVYNGIPHLLVPVVTDPKKASAALSWAVVEMEHRYKRFETMGVRDIRGYNNAIGPEEEPMSKIIVIIDELADLMMVAPGEVEESICRLAQLARAAGIHLVIATQRPSVNVITGVIKANIPSRIAFAVSSQIDSRTILDSGGAEKLLGKGDMLYAPQGASKPTRVQGCFVSDDEVQRIVDYVRGKHSAEYNEDVIEQMNSAAEEEKAAAGEAPPAGEPVDEMLNKAIDLAVEAGQVSISMLQRRLRVGYARAGRLVDEMTLRGITAEAEGPTKPRTVLISREEWRRMQENQE
ncbi:MAG: DNA translocase FtsK [Clostridia bacterium]|nr:DNA translocase FtsK [Clostridia bacterium]